MNQILYCLKSNDKAENFIKNRVSTYKEFLNINWGSDWNIRQNEIEKEISEMIVKSGTLNGEVLIPGYCVASQDFGLFRLRYQYDEKEHKKPILNWRESLRSVNKPVNNRTRAAMKLLQDEIMATESSIIYISEQVTGVYNILKSRYPNLIGSEYLGDEVPLGSNRKDGVRNEDGTNLSFDENQFEYLISFDVFEHIPNYLKALEESYRVLKEGGKLLFTIPFNYKKENVVRAVLKDDGSLEHLLEPEYHGNPLDKDGCLCYRRFGFQILDELRTIGFIKAEAVNCFSEFNVNLGSRELFFIATK